MVAKVFTYSYIREIVIDTRFILKICKLIKTTVACINLKMNLLTLNLWRADSFSVGLVNHARKYFTNSWLVTYENNTGISFASWVWRLHGRKYNLQGEKKLNMLYLSISGEHILSHSFQWKFCRAGHDIESRWVKSIC